MNEITHEMMNLAAMYLNSTSAPIKKIKVTTQFFNYLKQICHHKYLDINPPEHLGVVSRFTGIPVEVDDEIDGYYELVY